MFHCSESSGAAFVVSVRVAFKVKVAWRGIHL